MVIRIAHETTRRFSWLTVLPTPAMSHADIARSERSRPRRALAARQNPLRTSVTPSRQLVTTSLVSARTRAASASVASSRARLLTQVGSGALAASCAAPTFGAQLPRKTLPVRGQNLPQGKRSLGGRRKRLMRSCCAVRQPSGTSRHAASLHCASHLPPPSLTLASLMRARLKARTS